MSGKTMMVMKGVSPLPFHFIVILLIIVILLTLLFLLKWGIPQKNDYRRFDILRYSMLKRAFKARPFQFALQAPVVLVFFLIIITGLYGSQNPGRNLATIATWTVWWAGVIFVILFMGASWCLVCPWSALSDWIERVSLWKKKTGITLGYKWPLYLRNRHLMTAFFIAITWLELGIFITYSPLLTAYLALFIFLAILFTALIFEKKVFCRYICFVGGIVGMYSNLAPIEVRSRNASICKACKTKDCIKGNGRGYGCPIFEYPGGMRENTNCILCTECIKTCPHDNMTINLRPFFADIAHSYKGRFDESILILTLLGLTIFHGFTMLPIWFEWAIKTMKTDYYLYLGAFTFLEMAFVLAIIGAHYLLSFLIKAVTRGQGIMLRDVFIHYSYALLPVAIFYHLSHNLAHLNMEGSKIMPVLSDPFGWGWDILGTRDWKPFSLIGTEMLKETQLLIILIGVIASIFLSHRISCRLFTDKKRHFKILLLVALAIGGYSLLNLVTLFQPMVMRTVSYF